jgi:organic radical activating enzyme
MTSTKLEQTGQPMDRIHCYFAQFHAVLGIFLTNKCNALCAHCCTSSGPRLSNSFPIEALERALVQRSLPKSVVALHISGGEPFMSWRYLREISDFASKRHLLLAVNSNGYWGTTSERAAKTLDTVPALTHLLLSTDQYHEVYIPLSSVKNAAIAALERSIIVDLGICLPNDADNTYLDHVRDYMGEALCRRINCYRIALEAEGRATGLSLADKLTPMEPERQSQHCGRLNRPVILQDGRVSACCNTVVVERQGQESPLLLGTIAEESFSEISARANDDLLLQALRTRGPWFVANKLNEMGYPIASTDDDGICDLCNRILTNQPAVLALKTLLSSAPLRREIAIARAVHYDELLPLFELINGNDGA